MLAQFWNRAPETSTRMIFFSILILYKKRPIGTYSNKTKAFEHNSKNKEFIYRNVDSLLMSSFEFEKFRTEAWRNGQNNYL